MGEMWDNTRDSSQTTPQGMAALGTISFEDAIRAFSNPPADRFGFDICDEDKERWEAFVQSGSQRAGK